MPFSVSLLAAVVAMGAGLLCYGVASLLQAMAARRDPAGGAMSLLLSPLVLGGLALDVAGFAAGAVALTELPLFFVQGASSASILVTALLATLVLHERPDRQELLAMPVVLAGLAALALAAEPGPAAAPPALLPYALAACAPLIGYAGWWCARHPSRTAGLALAMLAGLSYGCASLAARAASAPDSGSGMQILILLVVTLHALQGVVLVTLAMRRAPVNTVTSVLFATEAVGPAAVGLLVLGDRTATGLGWVAVTGFVLLVVPTLLLSRVPDAVDDVATTGSAAWPRVDLRPTVASRPSRRSPTHRPGRRAPAVRKSTPRLSALRVVAQGKDAQPASAPVSTELAAAGRHRVSR